jgi:RNA polymerase sigma-70 factor, ECF subfamily
LRSSGDEAKLRPEVADVEEAVAEPAYKAGSVADFDRLYRTAYPRLKRTLTAILGDAEAAEDCVQDAFVSAFEAWPRWSPQAPAEVWMHRIALNSAFSYRRKRKLREVGELVRRLGRPEAGPDPAEAGDTDDLLQALRRLPPKVAAAIVLRYYHGYTNRDIASALGVSERMVGLRLAEAKKRLQADLGPDWSPGGAAVTVATAAAAAAALPGAAPVTISASGLPTSGSVNLSISGSNTTDA